MSDERQLRKATAEDVAACVAREGRPLSADTILEGMGMGDAQMEIATAMRAAEEAGLIVVDHVEYVGALRFDVKYYVAPPGPCNEPRTWTVEDSVAVTALAKAGEPVSAEVVLPSGRRLTADEANELIKRYENKES